MAKASGNAFASVVRNSQHLAQNSATATRCHVVVIPEAEPSLEHMGIVE